MPTWLVGRGDNAITFRNLWASRHTWSPVYVTHCPITSALCNNPCAADFTERVYECWYSLQKQRSSHVYTSPPGRLHLRPQSSLAGSFQVCISHLLNTSVCQQVQWVYAQWAKIGKYFHNFIFNSRVKAFLCESALFLYIFLPLPRPPALVYLSLSHSSTTWEQMHSLWLLVTLNFSLSWTLYIQGIFKGVL